MQIKHNFSGEWNDFNNYLRKYRLSDLLKKIDNTTRIIFDRSLQKQGNGVADSSFEYRNLKTGKVGSQKVYITGWDLIDLAYHAILATNDYRGRNQISNNEFTAIFEAELSYHSKQEHQTIENTKGTSQLLFYFCGFAGEQFKVQQPAKVFDNAARELYILFDIAPHIGFSENENIVLDETGVTWQVLISSLLLVWFAFVKGKSINDITDVIEWDDKFSLDEFYKVIDKYTADYKEIRNSQLKRQIFYAKPYVRTDRTSEVISVNAFLNLFIYEHAVLWTIRDNYKRRNSKQFTIDFGRAFEEYFHDLLSNFLEEKDYAKIPEGQKKRADWRVNICGYKFIIEQKSTILRLDVKQQNSNYESVYKFATETLVKALKQLKSTEDELISGNLVTGVNEAVSEGYIKVILLYDDYLPDMLLDGVFMMQECDIEYDHRYWLMTIEEMEKILFLYSTDANLCKQIIEQKLNINEQHLNERSSIDLLLSNSGYDHNEYLHQGRLGYYNDFAGNMIRMYLSQQTGKK